MRVTALRASSSFSKSDAQHPSKFIYQQMSGCWPVPLVGRKTAEGEIESATIKERHSDAEKVKRDAKVIHVLSKLGNVRNK